MLAEGVFVRSAPRALRGQHAEPHWDYDDVDGDGDSDSDSDSEDDQYLLRRVTKTDDGRYILKATNPDYEDFEADESMRTLARLEAVLDPLELAVGQSFMREEIPALFGH